MFEESEQRFSRFLPTSELSRLNNAGEGGTMISEDMRQVLTAAQNLGIRTQHLVEVGVGAAVQEWGYDATFRDIKSVCDRSTRRSDTTWDLDGDMVRLAKGTKLDLGGIVKGWTCDRVVEAGFAIVASAGGDVRSTDPSLVVEIVDDKDDTAAEVVLGIGALATSSRSKRRWLVEGREAHHIIDPRTMNPAITPVVSASVIAETATEAEAGAKAVLILGVDGLKWADAQTWIHRAIVVWHDGNVYGNTLGVAS
ncbi:MAG: FAD:protein FMN transferase [Actinomycetia bacterium]|nr:FAD:protein FMN transferase [Actinomycetes bacterium]